MGFMDDVKAKLNMLDKDGSGKVDLEDLKAVAREHGMEDKVDQVQDHIAGPDGEVTMDDAQRILGDMGRNIGDGVNGLKNKFFK